ncbi:Fructosamine/Ketosamine-3-kinase [Tirmania nivea]|nr:Fructosamine/Ketosamine-3-kinase [Tirmania nivea]
MLTALTELDPAIQNALPHGTELISIKKHGISLWTSTFKVETIADCKPANYFLKCALGERGKLMMEGELEGSKAIHAVSPDFCPRPIAAGKFSDPSFENTYFYICEFVEMTDEPFDGRIFFSKLINLHKNGKSPNGMYGFHITTCNGWIPQLNTWEQSWTTFFRKGFIYLLDMDHKNCLHPRPDGMDEHLGVFLNIVIPRLLLPLETGGNSIQPSLVHGDLWYGNTAATAEGPMIFDGAVFYAHNEYEFGNLRPSRNIKPHLRDSQMHCPKSQPEAEFDDRNRLYSMRFNLHAAILFPDAPEYQQYVAQDMAYLVEKYGG